jgi:hypothetical protein
VPSIAVHIPYLLVMLPHTHGCCDGCYTQRKAQVWCKRLLVLLTAVCTLHSTPAILWHGTPVVQSGVKTAPTVGGSATHTDCRATRVVMPLALTRGAVPPLRHGGIGKSVRHCATILSAAGLGPGERDLSFRVDPLMRTPYSGSLRYRHRSEKVCLVGRSVVVTPVG